MKNLTCEKCNTYFKDFTINETNMHCKCPPDKETSYDICNGIFFFLIENKLYSSIIQICYKNIEIEFTQNNFYFKINKNIIIQDSHNLKFSKNLIKNIEKQLIFLNKQERNLLFL